jgi:anti-sigma factor RsiW
MNKKILELLYRSFDERLNPGEQKILDQALSDSAELRAEKNRIAQMRAMISDSSAKGFHPFFAEKVLRRIRTQAPPAAESYFESLIALFRPVAIAAAILFIMLLSYNLFTSEDKSLATALAEPEIRLEQALDPTLAWVME